MTRTHHYVGTHLVDGVRVLIARCSCGQVYEGTGAGAALLEHLPDCPDEADALDVSEETEAWAAHHYDDTTCTLDEWRGRHG